MSSGAGGSILQATPSRHGLGNNGAVYTYMALLLPDTASTRFRSVAGRCAPAI
jgi:hypothetical protein